MFEKDIFIDYIGIFVVNVIYLVIWIFVEIVNLICSNILLWLDNVKGVLEEIFLGNCWLLNIKFIVMFIYFLFVFKILKFVLFKNMYIYNCFNIFFGILCFNIIFLVIIVCSIFNMIL